MLHALFFFLFCYNLSKELSLISGGGIVVQKKVFYAVFNAQTSLTETGDTVIADAGEFGGNFYSFHACGEFIVEDF